MSDIEAEIMAGLALEKDSSERETIDYFVALAQHYPDDARVWYETGGAYDSGGYPAEAIAYYRRAIELGLPEEYLPRITVQLGSSLRNVGQLDEAIQLLREGCARYPDHRALRAFLALALHSGGYHAEALYQMLDTTVNVPGFYEAYNRSLRNYADELIISQ